MVGDVAKLMGYDGADDLLIDPLVIVDEESGIEGDLVVVEGECIHAVIMREVELHPQRERIGVAPCLRERIPAEIQRP